MVADSGLTIATIREALTILPKPIFISFIVIPPLFYILYLLADLLDLRLDGDDPASYFDILSL